MPLLPPPPPATRGCMGGADAAHPQVEYRLVVQVLNENDNRPRFQPGPELTHNVSEVTPELGGLGCCARMWHQPDGGQRGGSPEAAVRGLA